MLIRFDFIGGPKDGESVLDVLDDRCFGTAAAYYHATGGGSPGSLVWCRTEYLIELTQILSDSALRDLHENGVPLRGHVYEVFFRSQGEADVRVRARHAGAVPNGVTSRYYAEIAPVHAEKPTQALSDDRRRP